MVLHTTPSAAWSAARPTSPSTAAFAARSAAPNAAAPAAAFATKIATKFLALAATWLATGAALPGPAAQAQTGDEVPFITTPDAVTLAMLRLANVQARDHVLDLGSGDGRIVITAARRFGASGLGVEIDPQLVQRSRDAARQAGVAERAEFREQDLFKTDLSRATVVTLYLLPEVNLQLRPALQALRPGTRVVSHDWDMGDWLPDRSLSLDVPDKAIGREKISRVHLWVVPAQVSGWWCGPQGSALWLQQRHQQLQGQLHSRRSTTAAEAADAPEAHGRATALWGQAQGEALHLSSTTGGLSGRLQLHWQPAGLTVAQADGLWAGFQGQRFTPAAAGAPSATTPPAASAPANAAAACGHTR